MIGHRPFPGDGAGTVTGFTVRGIPGLLMIGARGSVIIVQVAVHALGGGAEINAVGMAIDACGGFVIPLQREYRMIGNRPLPCDGAGTVTALAVG